MFFCGECLEVETVKKIYHRFPNVSVINAYGPTEATCCVSLVEVTSDMLCDNLIPVGDVSLAAVSISINDNEIILKGKSVFDGYLLHDVDACYKENGINCYKTGDIGFIKDNYYFL